MSRRAGINANSPDGGINHIKHPLREAIFHPVAPVAFSILQDVAQRVEKRPLTPKNTVPHIPNRKSDAVSAGNRILLFVIETKLAD